MLLFDEFDAVGKERGDAHDDALRAEALCEFLDQVRTLEGGRVDGNFVRAVFEALRRLIGGANAAGDAERYVENARDFRHPIKADLALLANVVLIAGVLSLLGSTLTLPGIAGIVLTVGMAVDANVLIFERIREELLGGKSPINAAEVGFQKARSAS